MSITILSPQCVWKEKNKCTYVCLVFWCLPSRLIMSICSKGLHFNTVGSCRIPSPSRFRNWPSSWTSTGVVSMCASTGLPSSLSHGVGRQNGDVINQSSSFLLYMWKVWYGLLCMLPVRIPKYGQSETTLPSHKISSRSWNNNRKNWEKSRVASRLLTVVSSSLTKPASLAALAVSVETSDDTVARWIKLENVTSDWVTCAISMAV